MRKWDGSSPRDEALHPTLYLLHGLSDDHTIWQRRTSIERYVEDYDLAVVMPAVNRSFYTDTCSGCLYWTFVSEELPYAMRSLFPLSPAREDNFVAGLSMGGYGSFKLALTHPERFAYAASFSGAMDAVKMFDVPDPRWQNELMDIFGSPGALKNSPNDLFWLASRLVKGGKPQPVLYQWCGTQDFLIRANRKFKKHAEKLGLSLTYEESPGDHSWKYWDEKIQVFLDMLPLKPLQKPVEPVRLQPIKKQELKHGEAVRLLQHPER